MLFAVVASVLLGSGVIAPPADAARGKGKAGVVVVHGDGQVRKDCVALTKREITGFRLLQRSKYDFQAAQFSFGHAICLLDGEGVATTDPDSCLPKDGPTWGYFTQDKGASGPTASEVGPDDRAVRRGAVDYWVFGTFPQTTPQTLKIRDICR